MTPPKRNILHQSPREDQGSEARVGYDYQDHCVSRLCLQMILSRDVSAIVCEYHEDVTQLMSDAPPCFYSIKKRETVKHWTLSLLKDALIKLFEKLEYKNVGKLNILANGRPDKGTQFCLYDLITLLDNPSETRDSEWEHEVDEFAKHLNKLFKDHIPLSVIQIGLRRLHIQLDWPHPDAIALHNCDLTSQVISHVWGVTCTALVAKKAYERLFAKVQKASKTPQLPLSSKRIWRSEAISILKTVICEEKLIADAAQTLIDTHTKLQRVGLESALAYALQMRMTARETKFALDLSATEWQRLKDDIATHWQRRKANATHGAAVLKDLRLVLRNVGEDWQKDLRNNQLGPEFAEGLFFEMLAICEANLSQAPT